MTTIQDVAKKAGVAPITVSRVINNSGYVAQEVRERVQAAIVELGYVPNSLARSLRSKRTNIIALVLTDITNPFFTTVARGVEDTASDAGFMVIMCNTDEREDEEQKYLRMLVQKRVDGVLLVPARGAESSIDLLQKQETAVVVLDRRVPNPKTDVVRCDSEGGAYQLGKLLASYGHKHVAVLTGPETVLTSVDRVSGCCRALTEAGLTDAADIYYGKFNQESGYQMAMAALQANPKPTALFAANNFLAIGALQALRNLKLRVPEDITLVGFDDLPPAMVTFPFLTVVAQPAYEMGQVAVRALLDRLNSTPSDPCREVILPAELIVRQSSGEAH